MTNRFLVVDTHKLNTTNRFVITGAITSGVIASGMYLSHPQSEIAKDLNGNDFEDKKFEIMKVELLNNSMQDTHTPCHIALLLPLDEIAQHNLDQPSAWIGKEVICG